MRILIRGPLLPFHSTLQSTARTVKRAMTPAESEVPVEVVATIARHLDLPDLLRLSAVSSTCRKGCYDPCAIREAVQRGCGGRLTRTDLQNLLKLDRMGAAALSHQYYPKTTYRPRSYYLYDADVVASAMRLFGENERVVSWRRTVGVQKPRSRKRVAAAPSAAITTFFSFVSSLPSPLVPPRDRSHAATPYANCISLPNASSCGSRAAWPAPPAPPALSSMLSASG